MKNKAIIHNNEKCLQHRAKGLNDRDWWNNRHTAFDKKAQGELKLSSSDTARYTRICRAFGLPIDNPHRELLVELAQKRGFSTFQEAAFGILDACKTLKNADQVKPTSNTPYEVLVNPYMMLNYGSMLHWRNARDIQNKDLSKPEITDILLAELGMFLQIYQSYKGSVPPNVRNYWLALKVFAKEYTVQQAAAMARKACTARMISKKLIFLGDALGKKNAPTKLDVTGLPTEMVEAYQETESVIAAWLVVKGRISLELARHIANRMNVDWLLKENYIDNPIFYTLPERYAAELSIGTKPVDLAPGLSRQEAHRWLIHLSEHGQISPQKWLIKELEIEDEFYATMGTTHGRIIDSMDITIIRWLAKKLGTTAFKTFAKVFVQGKVRVVNFKAYLDEITPADLVNGVETSPAAALRASRIRQASHYAKQIGKELDLEKPFPDPQLPDIDGITRICTIDQLVKEGLEMGHCVGGAGYQLKCALGENVILSVNTTAGRSTLQLIAAYNQWHMAQHLGPLNTKPEQENVELVNKWMASFDYGSIPSPTGELSHYDYHNLLLFRGRYHYEAPGAEEFVQYVARAM